MICPSCKSEYREGFTQCADCDVALVEQLGSDAIAIGGLEPVIEDASWGLIGELIERLEEAKVPYVVQAGTALPLIDGQVDHMDEPSDWAGRVWVPSAMSVLARQILLRIRKGS